MSSGKILHLHLPSPLKPAQEQNDSQTEKHTCQNPQWLGNRREPTPHYEKHMVHQNAYHRLTEEELAGVSDELGAMHSPHGFGPGIANFGQQVYKRKFTPAFMAEMNRSVRWWLERWCSAEAAE